ncbi:hypothetical protein [Methylophilus sp. 14]|uniref:hypothetical protein n=1 Tax=Methylophilus sp. 14 TaxID=2781019 RepID=UPI00188F8FC4|nr:hypothetical protein [Methylophilus sp. 14]MBF4988529.1 hypothetical protein [Methylophilus sp. 14]
MFGVSAINIYKGSINMLATLPADKTQVSHSKKDDLSPLTWRYGYIIACKKWFYATCSTFDNNNVLDIIIISNEDLLSFIQNPECKIKHIYLMTPQVIDGRVLRMQEIKAIYRSDKESCQNITIETEDGHLLDLSKDCVSTNQYKVYFCEALN